MTTNRTHRQWPAPRYPWLLAMRWHDLLFMHWPVPSAALRDYIPRGLAIDTFDGTAWIGVVPFRMSGVRPRLVPPLPGLSAFPELNVRTYVTAEGKPGVWFFSLDAANPVAVEGARDVFHLNYYLADMRCERFGDEVHHRSERVRANDRIPPGTFAARYRPVGPAYEAAPGSLDAWLTDRYCLYAANRKGRLWRCDIDHAPWPLQPAEAEVERNTMTEQIRLALPETKPLLHFSRYLEVIAWGLHRVEAAT